MLFYNNAEIDKIKNRLDDSPWNYGTTGSAKYGRLSDDGGSSYVWDSDGGKKKGSCTYVYQHYRIYADSDDRMYNPAMGYFVFGATHQDWYECYDVHWTAGSERAELLVSNAAAAAFGTTNASNYANFYNQEPYRQEGIHIWQSSGRASYVSIP